MKSKTPALPEKSMSKIPTRSGRGRLSVLVLLGLGACVLGGASWAAAPGSPRAFTASGASCSDVAAWEVVRVFGFGGIGQVAYSPDGQRLALATGSGIMIWNLEQEVTERLLAPAVPTVTSVAWSPDGREVAGTGWGEDPSVTLWDVESGRLRYTLRGHSANSCAVKKAEYKNHVWCWDFTMDETLDGRRLKWFSVVAEYTRECLALEVERRRTARDVVTLWTGLEKWPGAPGAIRSDNGPEFMAKAVGKWLSARKVGPLYIAPGSPWENGYSESFHSRRKAEFVDRELLGSLAEAKVLAAEYKRYWNHERLHSGIGYRPPAEFAAPRESGSAQLLRPTSVEQNLQPALINTGT